MNNLEKKFNNTKPRQYRVISSREQTILNVFNNRVSKHTKQKLQNYKESISRIAQWEKVLLHKPDILSSILRSHSIL